MKCRACNRKVVAALESRSRPPYGFCIYHGQAYAKLRKGYDQWCYAYGRISWQEYLRRVLERKETGSWVKDVITLELEKERKDLS